MIPSVTSEQMEEVADQASFVRAYNTDFLAPVVRNDWVLSGNALVNYTLAARWNAEMSYVYERGLTRTANASGREYERHLIALGIKYTFH